MLFWMAVVVAVRLGVAEGVNVAVALGVGVHVGVNDAVGIGVKVLVGGKAVCVAANAACTAVCKIIAVAVRLGTDVQVGVKNGVIVGVSMTTVACGPVVGSGVLVAAGGNAVKVALIAT